jgi:hypothetical protein
MEESAPITEPVPVMNRMKYSIDKRLAFQMNGVLFYGKFIQYTLGDLNSLQVSDVTIEIN